jgi:ParB-like chromosome segregation protein Spo0J
MEGPGQVITIQDIPLSSLKPAPYNPRQMDPHDLAKLIASIREFGVVDPLIVNKDMTVIGGNQRVKAIRAADLSSAPCVVVDLPPLQAKVLGLALNRVSGTWDEEKLEALLHELSLFPAIDLALTGFDSLEIDNLLKSFLKNYHDPDTMPDLPPDHVPLTSPGDLYELGPHRLLCGDATIDDHIDRLMGDGGGGDL